MKNIAINRVKINDIDELQKIGKQTFFETFATNNTEANMTRYLKENFAIEKLENELNDRNTAFYFAKYENQVIGYLKINLGQSQTELRDANALEIERIYVLKEYHGKRIGQLLYEKAVDIAKQNKMNYIWLGVWEENPRAIRFYEKNGFTVFDKHIFKLGKDEQTDIMMKLEL